MSKKAFLYKGRGVSPLRLEQLRRTLEEELSFECLFISAEEVKSGEWRDDASLFCIGGGRDQPYLEDLGESGSLMIRSFVEKGGAFLGICAGGYFASSFVRFAPMTSARIVGKRPLHLFQGCAVGPIYRADRFSYEGEGGSLAVEIKSKGRSFFAYYNGGCYFQNAHTFYPEVERLAIYRDFHPKKAAIILVKVGEGRALLSGVHLETRASDLPSTIYDGEMIEAISSSEAHLREFFAFSIAKLCDKDLQLALPL